MTKPTVLLAVVLSATASVAAENVAKVGAPPPLFELADEHGDMHKLEDLLGRPIILYFTHNMCHYCTQIIAFLKRAHARYEGSDLAILTLNVWAADEKFILRYKETLGLPFTMLAAKDEALLRNYEVNYVPIMVFIGRDGNVHEIYHHYVLRADFDRSTAEIVGE